MSKNRSCKREKPSLREFFFTPEGIPAKKIYAGGANSITILNKKGKEKKSSYTDRKGNCQIFYLSIGDFIMLTNFKKGNSYFKIISLNKNSKEMTLEEVKNFRADRILLEKAANNLLNKVPSKFRYKKSKVS